MNKLISIILFVVIFSSCDDRIEHNFSAEEIQKEAKKYGQRAAILQSKNIRLLELIDYPVFEDITLSIQAKNSKYVEGKNKFEFLINGYGLGEKTVGENDLDLAVEEGGQALNLVDANQNGQKKFSQFIEAELNQGENYLLAYLSRSYKMSLKGKSSYQFLKITTNAKDGVLEHEKSEPFLHLNEPNGIYDQAKNKRVLLDFFMVNLNVGKGKAYLKVKIDESEFKIYKWAPFAIEGLGLGKHKITIGVYSDNNVLLKGKLLTEITREFEITDSSLFGE